MSSSEKMSSGEQTKRLEMQPGGHNYEALALSRRQDATEAAVAELRGEMKRIESFTNFCAKSWLDRIPMKESREFAEKYLSGAQPCTTGSSSSAPSSSSSSSTNAPAPTSSPTEPPAGEGWGPDVVKVWKHPYGQMFRLRDGGVLEASTPKGEWRAMMWPSYAAWLECDDCTRSVVVYTRPTSTPTPQANIGDNDTWTAPDSGNVTAQRDTMPTKPVPDWARTVDYKPPAVPAQPAKPDAEMEEEAREWAEKAIRVDQDGEIRFDWLKDENNSQVLAAAKYTSAEFVVQTAKDRMARMLTAFARSHAERVKVELETKKQVEAALIGRSIHDSSRIKELEKENNDLLWNLAGCACLATGATKPGDYSKELARPALDSVSKLAERANKAERERDSLRAQLAAAERVIEAYNHVSQNILDSARYDRLAAAKHELATLKGKA